MNHFDILAAAAAASFVVTTIRAQEPERSGPEGTEARVHRAVGDLLGAEVRLAPTDAAGAAEAGDGEPTRIGTLVDLAVAAEDGKLHWGVVSIDSLTGVRRKPVVVPVSMLEWTSPEGGDAHFVLRTTTLDLRGRPPFDLRAAARRNLDLEFPMHGKVGTPVAAGEAAGEAGGAGREGERKGGRQGDGDGQREADGDAGTRRTDTQAPRTDIPVLEQPRLLLGSALEGMPVVDIEQSPFGRVEQAFVRQDTRQVEFVTVAARGSDYLVPIAALTVGDDPVERTAEPRETTLQLPYTTAHMGEAVVYAAPARGEPAVTAENAEAARRFFGIGAGAVEAGGQEDGGRERGGQEATREGRGR